MDESKYKEQLISFIGEYETTPFRIRTPQQREKYKLAQKMLSLCTKGVSLTVVHNAILCANMDTWGDGQTLDQNTNTILARKRLKRVTSSYDFFMRSMPPLPCSNEEFKDNLLSGEIEETWQSLRLYFIRGHFLLSKFAHAYQAAFGINLKVTKDPARLTQCKLAIYYELVKHMKPADAKRETIRLIDCAFPQLSASDEKKSVEALGKLISRHKS